MEPAIKQEVLDGDGPAGRVPNEYIESLDDEDNKAESKLEDIESILHWWAYIEGQDSINNDRSIRV
jgi:hypothetical protein